MPKPDDTVKSSGAESEKSGVSRREFLKISGISAAAPLVAGSKIVMASGEEVVIHGPGKTPMQFFVNGQSYKASLEPRVTLLDALRDHFDLTGAKRVCDRSECGACKCSWMPSRYTPAPCLPSKLSVQPLPPLRR